MAILITDQLVRSAKELGIKTWKGGVRMGAPPLKNGEKRANCNDTI
jgi:hypothetical protein